MADTSLFASDSTADLSADSTIQAQPHATSRNEPKPDVSAVRQAEEELDDAIRELATKAALAQDRGDIETAKDLSLRMLAAIGSRTPEHRARLSSEADARVDADACYFSAVGELAAAAAAVKSQGGEVA